MAIFFSINESNPEYIAHVGRLEKKIILVVNGYGCHLDSPLGWIYLPRVVRFIHENKDLIIAVVCCGGFTQRATAPGVAEAGLMAEYIIKQLGKECPPVEIEGDSYTSYENSKNGAKKIEDILFYWDGDESYVNNIRIVVTCEATRSANVIMLARHFMLPFVESIDDITVETASWERADPFKQVGNLTYNKLAITFPRLGLAKRERARRIHLSENR